MFYNEKENSKWQILFHLAYRFRSTEESVYGPAGAGTEFPMLFIATGGDKTDPTGTEIDGIAIKTANTGLYL